MNNDLRQEFPTVILAELEKGLRELGTFNPRDETPIYESHVAFAKRLLRMLIANLDK